MSPSPDPNLHGQVVIITGGNSGIGKETAVGLARMGAIVVITARSSDKGRVAIGEIRKRSGNDSAQVMALDLADFATIRSFAAEFLDRFDRLDVLVNNAGGLLTERQVTEQGFEMAFGVNHLGHFLLTDLLLDRLKESAPSRVIPVASLAHRFARKGLSFDDLQSERRYRAMNAYAKSKLANILFTTELARRLDGTGVTVNCVHPGVVRSGFGSAEDTSGFQRVTMVIGSPFFIGPVRGADSVTYLASSPQVEGLSGGYYVRRKPHRPSKAACDAAAAGQLWDASEALVAGPSS
jgi:NAD(P)-dependent dehydrogenase (short-subunit alcohol dehydrogenase family)